MARTVRVRAVPRGGTTDLGGGRSYRIQSGSMGAPDPHIVNPEEPFEAPVSDDVQWQAELRRRESAAGLAAVAQTQHPPWPGDSPRTIEMANGLPPIVVSPSKQKTDDLTGLPDRFTLVIEKKPDDWWKISAPEHHTGLFIAHKDLYAGLANAPGALALILRMDGSVPVVPKRRRTQ